ncbi:MAG: metallophosphoesterase, partial [Synergistetes bacterium]|nr:metallophosphoesterase [Synergistota bacterium]
MKRALKVLVAVSVVIALLSAVAFAGIIKSDNAAKWAMTSGQGKKSFSFIVFGDNRGTSPGRPLPEVLNVILREIGYIHPDFAINTGDIEVGYTDTLPKARAELMEFINRVKKYAGDVNMLFVPGNHEAPNAEIAQLYRKFFGKKLYYDFMYGNSHFVMLDTTFPRKWLKNGQKYGFYNVNDGMHKLAMVDWTQRVLKTKAEHTFVAQHVPLFSALTPNFGKHPKSFTSRGNRDKEL